MITLLHISLSPFCRFARLLLAEKALEATLIDIAPERALVAEAAVRAGAEALAGGVGPVAEEVDAPLGPILVTDGAAVGGATAIAEFLEELRLGRSLAPETPLERAEMRRWVEWAGGDFWRLAVEPVLTQRYLKSHARIGGPEVPRLRAAVEAARRLLTPLGPRIEAQGWLAGERLSLADFALAAQISVLDYLGDRPFGGGEDPVSDWYALMKSRPAFRGVLADRVPRLPPSAGYPDLDF